MKARKIKVIDMRKFSEDYKNKWVAFKDSSMDRVVTSGKSAHHVLAEARKLGVEEPIITMIPSKSKAYVL